MYFLYFCITIQKIQKNTNPNGLASCWGETTRCNSIRKNTKNTKNTKSFELRGLGQAGLGWAGPGQADLDRAGLGDYVGWARLGWAGPGQGRPTWIGLGWVAGLDLADLGWAAAEPGWTKLSSRGSL